MASPWAVMAADPWFNSLIRSVCAFPSNSLTMINCRPSLAPLAKLSDILSRISSGFMDFKSSMLRPTSLKVASSPLSPASAFCWARDSLFSPADTCSIPLPNTDAALPRSCSLLADTPNFSAISCSWSPFSIALVNPLMILLKAKPAARVVAAVLANLARLV